MKQIFLPILLLTFFNYSIAQNKRVNEIAATGTYIYNKVTVFDIYSGARARNRTGTVIGNGANLSYARTIYKNFYAKVGFGYFDQTFGIHRGFNFKETVTQTKLFYTTKHYSYYSLNYSGGIGYNALISKGKSKILPKNSAFRFLLAYNRFNTYKQVFEHDYGGNLFGNPNPQIRKDVYLLGSSVVLQTGLNVPVYKGFGIGIDLVAPVYNRWRKDEIFKDDMSEFHGADFSIGSSISINYNFKTNK